MLGVLLIGIGLLLSELFSVEWGQVVCLVLLLWYFLLLSEEDDDL